MATKGDWEIHKGIIELWFMSSYNGISQALMCANLSHAKSLSIGLTQQMKDQIKEIEWVCK